jgi:hypothetical protein
MYQTNEIFAKMPAATAASLFTYLAENEKHLVQVTIDSLAKQRNLRPVFVERKPKLERFAWMQEALGRPKNAAVAAHLLQIWLVGAHAKLLCDFLDALGIAHDENGTIEELPAAPDKAKLTTAVDTVFAQHDPSVVAVYLHAFQATDEHGWPSLEELLATDARLKL